MQQRIINSTGSNVSSLTSRNDPEFCYSTEMLFNMR